MKRPHTKADRTSRWGVKLGMDVCGTDTPSLGLLTFVLLTAKREINCWQTIRTDGFLSLTCHPACTANCHGIIYLCYQHPGLSKN